MLSENEEFEFRLRAEKEAAPPARLIAGIPGNVAPPPVQEPESLMDKIYGGVEMVGAAAHGVVAGMAEPFVGKKIADQMEDPPTTQAGKRYTKGLQDVLDTTGISALPPVMGVHAPHLAAPVARAGGIAAGKALDRAGDAIASGDVRNTAAETAGLRASAPAMAGGGAAVTDKGRMVMERAAGLDFPLKPTKAAVTFGPERFEQTQFERETAKEKAGAALLERGAENNEAIIKNFDAWIDQTGAEAPELRDTGKAVDKALVAKMKRVKGQYQALYQAAEKDGEMRAPVSTEPLVNFLNENRSAARLAPVLSSAEDELVRLGGATRGPNGALVPDVMRLNDVEKARKLMVRLSKVDDVNGHYAGQANEVIDAMTEGKGGEMYQRARAMFKRYADEFKNTGVVKKLVSTKPGTNDRAVALEDVFRHSILTGSLDDVRAMRKTLQTEGETGSQAWRELQGQTVNYLKDQAVGGAARDIRQNPIVNFGKLDKAVNALDKDGKLDFIFGKQGAQKVRDLRDLSADVITAPPGSVNYSNSASALKKAFGELLHFKMAGLSTAVGAAKDAYSNYQTGKRVQEALNPQGAANAAGIGVDQPLPQVFRSNRRTAAP